MRFLCYKLLREPQLYVAPWTVARAILENCAVMWWLVSPEVTNWRTRALREMRLNLCDIDNFEKYRIETVTAFPDVDWSSETIETAIKQKRRINRLATELNGLDDLRSGMPTQTILVRGFIEPRTFNYRALSSFAHGRESLIGELLLQGISTRLWRLEMSSDIYHVWSLINASINWIAKATWGYFNLTGWNYDDVYRIVSEYYDERGLADESRFVPQT